MTQQTRLIWRRHRLSRSGSDALRRTVLSLATPSAAPTVEEIDFPELPESPQAKAATLLRVAAQIEHTLMVQYLYAAYSFGSTQRVIADIAIEEMSHLMTVQNLLRCIGEKPHLIRQDDRAPVPEEERLYPFDFRLEPLTDRSLAKYVVAESPNATAPDVDTAVMARIVELATDAAHEPVNHVGTLYGLLGAVFGSQQLLLERAATGDEWFVAVNQLAAEAAEFYGGRDTLHLPDSAFDSATVPTQGSDTDWDRSVEKGFDEFRVHTIGSRPDALDALHDIGLQGEGPSPTAGELAHFRRFYDLFVQFFVTGGASSGVAPGVLDVPSGSDIAIDPDGSGPNVISHPKTGRWARLADLRYALLLGALEHYLVATASAGRTFLRGWCFAEMSALSRLASVLRRMPRAVNNPTQAAALPFNRPAWEGTGVQWSDLAAAYGEAVQITDELMNDFAVGTEEHRLLVLLHASDTRKRDEAMARQNGSTSPRTRTDEVRDTLDWAAGAGNPRHNGNSPVLPSQSQSRFWNLQHPDLVEVVMFGQKVTERQAPDEDALLVQMLRVGGMPQNRPQLDPSSDEFRIVEQWIADGCPDDVA